MAACFMGSKKLRSINITGPRYILGVTVEDMAKGVWVTDFLLSMGKCFKIGSIRH